MQNYIEAKLNITKNQTEDDFLLLNFDDELLMQQKIKTRAKIFYFSTKQKVVGCYVKGGSIYFNDNLTEKRLISIKNLKLLGEHNLSNVLCGVLAVYLQTKNVEILKNVSKFNGVEHRIEYVGKAGGVLFYNDSKSTNISSTLVATRCFKQNTLLILGGSDKGYGFDELFKNLPNSVKKIAVFGETKQKILKSAKAYGFCKIYAFDNLRQCVYFCKEQAEFGDVVLLSPACASFDQFNNFEERGMVFKKIVKEIILNESSLFEDKKTT